MKKELRFKILSEGLDNGVSVTCRKYNISRTLYYRWLERYKTKGMEGLEDIKKAFTPANKTDEQTEVALLNLIKEYPHYGPRALKYLFEELGYSISESAIYNIMKRNRLTQKEDRIQFAKKKVHKITSPIPSLTELHSGECWLFWVTDYGYYKHLGNLYEYTLYDLKSRIACTRLYNELSFTNFEDLLTAVAMPVAKTLNLNVHYLCFLKNNKILGQLGKTFKSKINKIILDHGFDFKIHILRPNNKDLCVIDTLRKHYTENCLSFLMPRIQEETPFSALKVDFQEYLRDYNLNHKDIFDDGTYTPVEYHNKCTDTKLILPIWAYIDRAY